MMNCKYLYNGTYVERETWYVGIWYNVFAVFIITSIITINPEVYYPLGQEG